MRWAVALLCIKDVASHPRHARAYAVQTDGSCEPISGTDDGVTFPPVAASSLLEWLAILTIR